MTVFILTLLCKNPVIKKTAAAKTIIPVWRIWTYSKAFLEITADIKIKAETINMHGWAVFSIILFVLEKPVFIYNPLQKNKTQCGYKNKIYNGDHDRKFEHKSFFEKRQQHKDVFYIHHRTENEKTHNRK